MNVNTGFKFLVTSSNSSDFIGHDLKYIHIHLLVDQWLNDLLIENFYKIFPGQLPNCTQMIMMMMLMMMVANAT